MNRKIIGTGVALPTPMKKDGSIDREGTKKLVQHVIDGGVDFLVPLGTTGESVTLSHYEKLDFLNLVLQTNDSRLPVVLGLGGNNTAELMKSFDTFDFTDINAILSVTPYYNKPSQNGLYAHYSAVAERSPVPVILYNVPGRTGTNIEADTVLRLASDFKNIVGIKEASGNFNQCMAILAGKQDDFTVLSGEDALTLPLISLGMEGVISVVGNAYPRKFSDMVRIAMLGDFKKASTLHYSLLDFTHLIFAEGNPAGIKCALNILNICEANMRLPLVEVSRALREKLENEMISQNN